MFEFYTVEEWEEHLEEVAPIRLIIRRERDAEANWSANYILIQNQFLTKLDCLDWIENQCEGEVRIRYSHQYEFILKKDALLFKIVWSK